MAVAGLITTAQNIHSLDIDKVSSPANFHPNHDCYTNKWLDLEAQGFAHISMFTRSICPPIFIQIVNVVDLHFEGQRFKSSILGNSNVIISQTVTNMTNIDIANTSHQVASDLSIGIFTFDHGPFSWLGSRSCTFRPLISGQTFLLPTNRKSHKTFPFAYLYLTLTHSKGQGQGHAHFDCKYLINDER